MSDPQPRQRHFLERVETGPGGQTVTAEAVRADGGIRYFQSAEAAHVEAGRLGGRAAGYRVMQEFIDDEGKPTTMKLRGDFLPCVIHS